MQTKLFEISPSLKEFAKAIESNDSWLIENLESSSKAFLAAFIAKTTQKSILLITKGTSEDKLFDDLSYFNPNLPIEFPSWETLPGEEITPSPDILGKRFEALHSLIHKKTPSIVLCPLQALLQKVISPAELKSLLHTWRKKMTLSFDSLDQLLTQLGYQRHAVVSDKGQFAIRGGILDLFPTSSPDPYRIEFFEDEIEEIRTFDPVGQKSIQKVDSFFLPPATELSLLRQAKTLSSISDYLPSCLIFWDDLVTIEETYVNLKNMPGAKSSFFYPLEEAIKQFQTHIFCTPQNVELLSPVTTSKQRSKYIQPIAFEALHQKFQAKRFFHPFQKIEEISEIDPSFSFHILSATQTEEEEIKKQLASFPLREKIFSKGYLSTGFVVPDAQFALLANGDFSKRHHVRRQKWRSTHHTPASEFHALSPGDPVVHFHSGIGKYIGLEKQKNHLGVETEFLVLEYAENSKLFVPISQAYLVSRYIGSKEETPTLSQLGTKRWQKMREAAQTQIVGYANDLLQRQAERVVEGGYRYKEDDDLMQQFEADFPYSPTEDQMRAISDIKQDMISGKSMDRLVCGDVGYGKTEVAMRTAFKAVVNGNKQVAVLVPTTVLAMQHFETFSERMKGFPIKVAVISRFQTAKEAKEILEKTKQGEIDILIGTHRLLSQDIKFKDLGLIIIDEEQKFGVRSKESLKKLKTGAGVITLSATPIPRTLYMSLIHIREMSVINTPPQDRLPIKTIIAETDFELIQNALLRELSRGGQAFFIHNRVETIHGRAEEIHKIVPSARIAVVHGQMDTDDIDLIFHKFKQGDIDLLFATTIIESGIDIPNANTILIDRADTYGLADLYQLRGRVGRWNRAAYTYFLIPKNRRLSEIAQKRLNALVEAGGYGGGMKIAMRDLEIRGAGDILGVQQSGQISAIGFHLYCKLLKRAIDSLKQKKPISFTETKLEFSFPASLPENYINEVSLRMELYHRLGEASSLADVDSIFEELKDRFGKPPEAVIWLYHLSRIRVLAAQHHFSLIKFGDLSFTAEKQRGKQISTHTFLLPKKIQSPKALETYVTEKLMSTS